MTPRPIAYAGLLCLTSSLPAVAAAQAPDWGAVDAAMGRPSISQPGGLHRYAFPRGDLHVTVGPVEIRPAFALGGWVTMAPHGAEVIAMGDLVLTTDELGPVIARLQQGGIEQSAIHHHLVGESPRVLYVHVHAHGNPVALAETVRAAVALTAIPAPAPSPAGPPPAVPLDTVAIAKFLGAPGRVAGGVLQFSIPRKEPIVEGDFTIPPAMGLGTAINFEPLPGGRAAITGDFVMTAAEVNPVLRELQAHGIQPTSLHGHLLDESPRLFFMHFWGVGDPLALARGLAAGLDRTASARAP